MIDSGDIIFSVLAFFLVLGASIWLSSSTCAEKSRLMKKRHNYGLISGCMIESDGAWVPIESYRTLE